MRKTSKIILVTIIATSILLGLGYAAIQNITLNVKGWAYADPNQSNFKVKFTGTPLVSDGTYVIANIIEDTKAAINVNGLTEKGQKVTATYEVINESTDISSDLSIATSNSNTEYFSVSSKLAKTSLTVGESTTVTVTVELLKTPINGEVETNIGINLVAYPVEPGKEGTKGPHEDFSELPGRTTLKSMTDYNIGDYVDIGNNFVGTDSTSDDWRVLWVYHNENDVDQGVYLILADYLPVKYLPDSMEIQTDEENYPYSVWSDSGITTLLTELVLNSDFGLNNWINGSVDYGMTIAGLLANSLDKSNTQFEIIDEEMIQIDKNSKLYDLYVPNSEVKDNCSGYWLWNFGGEEGQYLACLNNEGKVTIENDASLKNYGTRPIVYLPFSRDVEMEDNVWKVIIEN